MDYIWIAKNHLENLIKNRKKTVRNLCQNAMCERKITSEREILFKRFCSHSPSIIEQKFYAAKPFAFCSTSGFGVTKIITSIWLQENENVKGVCVCVGGGGSNFQNRPSHNEYVSTTVSVNRILGDY